MEVVNGSVYTLKNDRPDKVKKMRMLNTYLLHLLAVTGKCYKMSGFLWSSLLLAPVGVGVVDAINWITTQLQDLRIPTA